MKKTIILFLSLALGVMTLTAQRSDSEIKRDFEKGYRQLMKDLRTADSVTIAPLAQKVAAFRDEYRAHQEFLNKSVYPDGYDETVAKLEDQLKESQQLAESQGRIAELESQVRELSGRIDAMSDENARLIRQLDSLKTEMTALRKKVAELQDKIVKRDAAVFALVDSLFVQYDTQRLSSSDMKKITSLEKNNVLTNIKRSVNDNVSLLATTGTDGLDFPRLLDEQRKFEKNWKGIGSKLADAYISSKDRAREIAAIDTMVAGWRTQVDEAFWKALHKLFTDNNVAVAPFANGDEFHASVLRYLEEQMAGAEGKSDAEQRDAFEAFAYNTWGAKVKPVWLPVMKRAGFYTDDRESEVDTKVKLWEAQTQPGNTLLYLLGAALALAVLAGLYLGMKKRTPSA